MKFFKISEKSVFIALVLLLMLGAFLLPIVAMWCFSGPPA